MCRVSRTVGRSEVFTLLQLFVVCCCLRHATTACNVAHTRGDGRRDDPLTIANASRMVYAAAAVAATVTAAVTATAATTTVGSGCLLTNTRDHEADDNTTTTQAGTHARTHTQKRRARAPHSSHSDTLCVRVLRTTSGHCTSPRKIQSGDGM